ncbi:MAG TPA: hypothetical protein VK666_22435 [Chryseolinea sp.]|nr:hypothetical protein [Chryseolinea sp.]
MVKESERRKRFNVIRKKLPLLLVIALGLLVTVNGNAQDTKDKKDKKDWENDGEIENVEIEIVKERQIILPEANRNFDKIPPRASEPIKPPITYDFRTFNFQAPQINTQIRPLKVKQEGQSRVYGGYLRAGFGNYISPLLEGYFNTTRDKNKLIGAHAFHNSSDRGPRDGTNSGSGSTALSVFGKTFNEFVALSGNVGFENRTTHFYGYAPGVEVDAKSIKQSFNVFKLAGELANSKNSDFSYKLGAGFSNLADKYAAKETQIDLAFNSAYEMDEDSRINLKADYTMINRKDALLEGKARNLFVIAPSYDFMPVEKLKVKAGFIVAFENDTIDSKSTHIYPDFKASYPLSPAIDAVASLNGGIEKVSLQSLSYENLWLGPNVPIFHTNKTLDLTVGLNAKLGSKVSAHAGLSLATLKNQYYFVNSEADQAKFTTVYDQGSGTKRANFYVAVSYLQSELAKFMLRGDLYNYSTSSIEEAWHRPTYRLTANGSYNVYDKILLSADIIAQGGMKALDPATDKSVKLNGAFDLNFKTEYLFSQSFSAFVQLNNITSNKYPLFLNYPVRGFQVMGGITWSF